MIKYLMVWGGGENKLVGEDEDLPFVLRCQHGENEAFSVLVERHQKKMLNIAYRMTGDYDEACDCVQEVFLSAYRAIGKFRRDARFATWLYGIMLNHVRNRLHQMKHRSCREDLPLADSVLPADDCEGCAMTARSESALEHMVKAEREEAVQTCIRNLETDYREVLILRDIHGLAYEDIQSILKIPPGTVKSRLFRARLALKDCLVKILGDDL